ncbi:hypothetical protein D6774_02495 [Candidatus Woesearchaeota archaeon]|nr:MAG: hypothetical protein D6774_02495 [Candidatus Woesearchaeota archaeon]
MGDFTGLPRGMYLKMRHSLYDFSIWKRKVFNTKSVGKCMKKRTALILSGGGSRGAFEAGAISALLKKITPDVIIGTSIGAINGAVIAGGASAQKLEEYWRSAKFEELVPQELSPLSFLEKSVLAHEEKLEELLREILPVRRFEQCKIPLFINAFNVDKKEEVIFHKGLLIPAILASCSIYPFFPPTKVNNERFIDTLKVPDLLRVYKNFSFDRAIIINLYGDLTPTWQFKVFLTSLINQLSKKNLYKNMQGLEKQGVEIISIESKHAIHPADFSHTEELIEEGRKKAEELLRTNFSSDQ